MQTDQTSNTAPQIPAKMMNFDATQQENASLIRGSAMENVTVQTTRTNKGVKTLLPVTAASFSAIKRENVSLIDGFVMVNVTVQTARTNKVVKTLRTAQAASLSAD